MNEYERFLIKNKKPKMSSKNKFAVAMIGTCMIGSGAFGFGGTYLANMLTKSSVDTSGKAVLYQSVMKTNSQGEETGKMSVSDVATTTKSSVVEISTETATTNGRFGQLISTGAGSGVIITTDGYIVTNNHVIDKASTIKVKLSDGKEYTATLIGKDSKTDLAVIKINKAGLTPAVFGSSSKLTVGETAIAIGNPLGSLGGTVTEGIISALGREITIDGETMSLLQTSAAINPGNSGGGLFNLYGELVGIVNAKSSGTDIEGLGFAIPIDTAKSVIEDIIENGYARGRIDTGFTLVDIQDAGTAMSYRVSKLGLYILKSDNENFKNGDIITAIDNNAISDLASYNTALNKYKVGDTIQVTVTRGSKSETYSLTLGELKS